MQNTSNVISYELYQTLRNKVLNWANETSPGTYHLYYTKYSNVAFMSLLEDDQNIANQWKDNMINLALHFDQNFYQPNNHPTGSCFHANFYTIATALIYDYCYERLTESQKMELINRVKYGMDYLHDYALNPNNYYVWKYHNWQTHFPVGYVIGGLAIVDDSPVYTSTNLQNDLDVIKNNLFFDDNPMFEYMFGNNGSYNEGNGYFGINFGRTFLLLQALTNYENFDYFHLPVVQNALCKISNWLTSSILPNKQINYFQNSFIFNGLNDNGNVATASLSNLLLIAEKYNDGLARWVFEESIGTPSYLVHTYNYTHPEAFIPCLIAFKEHSSTSPQIKEHNDFYDYERGLVNYRTGWNNDDLLFSIESTPVWSNEIVYTRHTQCDKGSFTLTALGNNFIFDKGGDLTDDNNYISIEGHGQSLGFGQFNWLMNSGKISSTSDYNFLRIVKARTKSAFDTLYHPQYDTLHYYTELSPPPPGTGEVYPVDKADRTVFYLTQNTKNPSYFWVIDEIKKDDLFRTYDWHVYTRSYNSINTSANPITIYRPGMDQFLDIYIIYPEENNYSTTVTSLDGIENSSNEIIMEPENYRLPTKKLQIFQNNIDGCYNILLIPYNQSTPSHLYGQLNMTIGTGVKITWSSNLEDFCFYSSIDSLESALIQSNSSEVFLRQNSTTGKIPSYYMGNGSKLNFDGQEMVDFYGNPGVLACDSNIVSIIGENISEMKIYAPYATSVILNEEQVSFYRVNEYVYVGSITGEKTWNGNVLLSGNVVVSNQGILNVQAGSNIIFDQSAKLSIYGELNCHGEVGDSIYISSNEGSLGYGISIYGMVEPSGEGSLSFCAISGLSNGIESIGTPLVISHSKIENCSKAINLINSNAIINENQIIDCGYGIFSENSSPVVTNNTISNCSGHGVYLVSASGYFQNNIIQECSYLDIPNPGGFIASYGSAPVFEDREEYSLNSIINNNGFGIQAYQNSTIFAGDGETFGGNIIYDNHNYDAEALYTSTIYAMNNYWGTDEPSDSQFHAEYESEVFYEPWLTSPPEGIENINSGIFAGDANPNYQSVSSGQPLENPNWKKLFIRLYRQKNHKNLIPLGKSLLQNLPSANDAIFIISLMHHSSIAQGDTSIMPYLKFLQNLPFPIKVKNFSKILLAFNSLNYGKISEALGLFKDIQIQNPNTKEELLALFEEFHIYLYYLHDLNLASNAFNIMKAKFPNNSLTVLAENELEATKCIYQYQRLLREKYPYHQSLSSNAPITFHVSPNYPNPFNPITTISYTVPEKCKVEIVIYDILGRKVRSLLNEAKDIGTHEVRWNGMDDAGFSSSSGVYIYSIKVLTTQGSVKYQSSKKMLLIR